jgi:hypothetical protein
MVERPILLPASCDAGKNSFKKRVICENFEGKDIGYNILSFF